MQKTLAQNKICKELNLINSNDLSYTKSKSTVGVGKKLMASLYNLWKEQETLVA